MSNKIYWDSFYHSDTKLAGEPSSYALICASEWGSTLEVIDVGCGNGRDAVYFALLGHNVIGLDISESAVELCKTRCNRDNIKFFSSTLVKYAKANPLTSVDVVYSRFSLHAMNEAEALETLEASGLILKPGGRLYIECRSINDPMAQLGEKISEDERIFGHYRRFIRIEKLTSTLTELGFKITSAIEVAGVTPLGDDDPVVIRLAAINKK